MQCNRKPYIITENKRSIGFGFVTILLANSKRIFVVEASEITVDLYKLRNEKKNDYRKKKNNKCHLAFGVGCACKFVGKTLI